MKMDAYEMKRVPARTLVCNGVLLDGKLSLAHGRYFREYDEPRERFSAPEGVSTRTRSR